MGFLEDMTAATGLAGSIGSLLGKSQISNRDYDHAQNLADKGNPREIQRQGAFLEGLAPSQANAYNTYQDQTYTQDTQRQTDRIKSMSSGLGMSPWEITGSGGANPLPSPQQSQGNSSASGQFMSQLIPLKIAKMNANTQLASTKMQTDAQMKVAGVTPQKGSVQEQQRLQAIAQRTLTDSHSVLAGAQTDAARNEIFLSNIRELLRTLPDTDISIPGLTMRGKTGADSILQAMKQGATGYQGNNESIAKAIEGMPKDRWQQMKREIEALAKGARHMADKAVSAGQDFLSNMTRK